MQFAAVVTFSAFRVSPPGVFLQAHVVERDHVVNEHRGREGIAAEELFDAERLFGLSQFYFLVGGNKHQGGRYGSQINQGGKAEGVSCNSEQEGQ